MKANLPKARSKYHSEYLESALKEQPKSFWSYIKNLRKENSSISDLKEGDKIISGNREKAEYLLNHQFTSVFAKETPGNYPIS